MRRHIVILNKLKLSNFKSYTIKEFKFEAGLIGIIGKNGSGKSTIFEAILFALYGELRSKGSKELIRNSMAAANETVNVELDFEFDGKEYTVIREFRGKTLTANAKLYSQGLFASGAREVTTAIIKLTKMSKDAFMHTLFASQKELTSLSGLRPEERKKIIRKLLGLEKIDYVEGILIETTRELKQEIQAVSGFLLDNAQISLKKQEIAIKTEDKAYLTAQIKVNDSQLIDTQQQLISLKQDLNQLQQTKDYQQQSATKCKLLQTKLNGLLDNKKRLTDELSGLKTKEATLASILPKKQDFLTLQGQLKKQQQLKEFDIEKQGLLKEQTNLRGQYSQVDQRIVTLTDECKGYAELKMQEAQKQIELQQLKDNIANVEDKVNQLSGTISGEKRLIEQAQSHIDKIKALGKEANCPTCTRPLLAEYDSVIGSLSATITTIQTGKIDELTKLLQAAKNSSDAFKLQEAVIYKDLKLLLQQVSAIEIKQRDLEREKQGFEKIKEQGLTNKRRLSELEQFTYDVDIHKSFIDQEEKLQPIYDQIQELETEVKRIDKVNFDIKQQQADINTCSSELNESQLLLAAIVYDDSVHITKKEQYEKLDGNKDSLQKSINAIQVKVATLVGEINTIQTSIDTNNKHLDKLAVKQQDLTDYNKIKISLTEFKTRLNSKVAPRISQVASDMYARITKGKYQHIEVSNEFDFYIYDEEQQYPIERFSGGEIDLANLVLRIAISKTLSELSGAGNIGFLAFDEIFGSQDETRRLEILEAFHTIKEQYRQIFLISHEMEIKEMFEKIIEL